LPFLQSVPLVIVVNAVFAFAIASVGPVVTMLVVEDAPESAWNSRIARLNKFQGYGGMFGLVVGAFWMVGVSSILSAGTTQQSLFIVAAFFGIASAMLATRWLPRRASLDVGPRRSDRVATSLARTNRNIRDATFSFGMARFFWAFKSLSGGRFGMLRREFPRALVIYFVASFFFFTGFGVFWAPLPLYLRNAGFSSGAIFGIYLVNTIGSAALFDVAAKYCDKHDIRFVQGGALGTRAFSFLGIGLLGVVGSRFLTGDILVPLVVVGLFITLVGVTWAFIAVTGTAIVSRISSPQTRGGILGIYAALAAIASALGSLTGGWLASQTFTYAFIASFILVISGAFIVVAARQISSATVNHARISGSSD
ncbi:MAG: MFS transporter, partial [Halobacteria archaeon]|nr:MFS transporter [Halobacteria archaeon]